MKTLNFTLICIMLLMLSVATAQASTAYTYQGRLNDSDEPADGLYDFRFQLYSDPDGLYLVSGTVLKDDVDVVDGYFTTEIDFASKPIFNGQALWLQIEVRPGASVDPGDYVAMQPLQSMTPTPYAINADMLDGLEAADLVNPATDYGRSGVAAELYEGTTSLTDIYVDQDGDLDMTGSFSLTGWLTISGITPGSQLLHVQNYGNANDSCAILGRAAQGGNIISYGVKGYSIGNLGYGVYGVGDGTSTYGVYGEAAGEAGRGVHGKATGISAYATSGYASGANGIGLYGEATGTNAKAVYGLASNTGNYETYGGWFKSKGASGRGIYAESTGWYGRAVEGIASGAASTTNYGGYFTTAGNLGRAVYGEASVTANYLNVGGYFIARGGNGYGIYGEAASTNSTTNYGGYFLAKGATGRAVYGEASTTSSVNYGGYFKAAGSGGRGVYGEATNENSYGGYFVANNLGATGIYAQATAGASKAADFVGDVEIDGDVSILGMPTGTGSTVLISGTTLVKLVSSARYKKNIADLNVNTRDVFELRPVTYQYRKTNDKDIGLIAEEVAEHISDLVIYDRLGRPDAVKYDRLAVYLLEIVKDQQQRIEKLETALAAQQNNNKRLELIEAKLNTNRSAFME